MFANSKIVSTFATANERKVGCKSGNAHQGWPVRLSSLKRIRQEETRRLHNRYYGKTMRNAVRKLRATTDKAEATAMYPGITKMLDKLAKTNVIHKNKANNLKSKLAVYINKLG